MASINVSNTNPFRNAIQLEEITHFQRPTKSILNTFQSLGPKKVSYADQLVTTQEFNEEEERYESEPTPGPSKSSKSVNEGYVSGGGGGNETLKDSNKGQPLPYFNTSKGNNGLPYASSSSTSLDSESDIEFHRDYRRHKKSRGRSKRLEASGFDAGGLGESISDENLFPIPNIQVTKLDLIFAFISLLTNLGELVTDFTLVIWHFQSDQKWASGLTMSFICFGAIGMLHQFSLMQPDHLNRLFRKGKRVRILVNCFPPAASCIVSFEGTLTAWRAFKDPMVSQQYFKIYELLRSLSRVQSFYQAAPQATLQLLILLENFHEISFEKLVFTFMSIAISLIIMMNANLPSKIDAHEDSAPNRAAYIPLSRIFIGMRMFSSLGSRVMALTYLLMGCRCLFNHDGSSSFTSTLIGMALLTFPRVVFALTDYLAVKLATRRNLERYMEQPEIGISSSHPIAKIPFLDAFVGYLATVFFPVGDPLWLFWYLWSESGIFVIFGNVAGITHECVDGELNGIYTGVFFVVFIIVPIIIPYVKAVVSSRKARKFIRVLEVIEESTNNYSSGGNSISVEPQSDTSFSTNDPSANRDQSRDTNEICNA